MKKMLTVFLVFVLMTVHSTGWAETRDEKSPQVIWFQAVTQLIDDEQPDAKPIYLNDRLVVSLPSDWVQTDATDVAQCAFEGRDTAGNSVVAEIRVVDSDGLSPEAFSREATQASEAVCQIRKDGITFFVAVEKETLYAAWLSQDEGLIYMVGAFPVTPAAMVSPKLTKDLHTILCGLRPVYEGELEQRHAGRELVGNDFSGEESVDLNDMQFGQMIREALEKEEGEAVYPSELAAIRRITMRGGTISFTEESLQPRAGYKQDGIIDLHDLASFPNLKVLNITDMKCAGYDVLADLKNLSQLTLIRTGITDCTVLGGLHLESLSLAGNSIEDFSPIASMADLRSLNLFMTGLDTLEIVRDLSNLELLVVGENPISELAPIEGLTALNYLGIQKTEVTSLDPLTGLTNLETLDISDLGPISLAPLYDHEKLRRIIANVTELSQADRDRFADIL